MTPPRLTVALNLIGATRPTTGVERYVLELAPRLLAQKPRHVRLIAITDAADGALPNDLSGYASRMVRLRPIVPGPLGRHLATQAQLPWALRRAGADLLLSPMNVGPIAWRSQLVVLHDIAWHLYPSSYRRSFRVLHWLLAQGYRAQRIPLVADALSTADDLRPYFSANSIRVVHPGPGKTARLRGASRHPRLDGGPVKILWLGSVEPRKDLATAVRACELADRAIPRGVKLTIAGGTGASLARGEAPPASVLVVDTINHPADDEVDCLYAESDVLLFTSRYEGFGLPPLEALSRGVPVVSSDLPSLKELDLEGITYCPVGDASAFSSAIVDIVARGLVPPRPPRMSWDQCATDMWAALLDLQDQAPARALPRPPPKRGSRLHGSRRLEDVARRAIDISGAALVLAITSPLLLVAAAAVKLEDGGPIFFRRRVLARGGAEFDAYKLRTMGQGAQEMLGYSQRLAGEYQRSFKLRHDPRVTSVGRILRKTSIDEIPQMVNVLRGQMSLVGPRMMHPPELEKFGELGPRLLEIRPGITGLWQVSGRQELSFSDRLVVDCEYLDRRSLWLDIKIMLRTPLAVIRGRGAY